MSEDRAPSGGCNDMQLKMRVVIRSSGLSFAGEYGRLDIAGAPRLRIALPDTRCPRIELRAVGCTLLRNEYSDVVWK